MITRRNLLQRGATATVFASTAIAVVHCQPVEAPAAEHADAALLALQREFDIAVVAVNNADAIGVSDDEMDRLVGTPFEIGRRMTQHSPTTLDGLAAKLRAYIYCSFDGMEDGSRDFGEPERYAGDALILSIADDVAALRRAV